MKTRITFILIACVAFSFLAMKAFAANDTVRKAKDSISGTGKVETQLTLPPYHWNVIKLNLTPMLIWTDVRNITFSYERLIKKNQSIAIQLGYLVIPQFIDTVVKLVKLDEYKRQGINIAFDYRYYPALRNRRPAPDGLYLGAYLSYYGFMFSNQLHALNSSAEPLGSFKGKLNMINLGIEIGYQFIFWKRFSVDLLMFGPSLTCYYRQLEITGTLSPDQIDQIDSEFVDKLEKRFPLLGILLGGETANFSGTHFKVSAAFRYSVQFGIHF